MAKNIRKNLRNGCSRTEVFISPKNYKSITAKSDLDKPWFIECRFFDPKFQEKYPKGFPFRKKLNMFPTLRERKEVVSIYKKEVEKLLDEKHFNPITKKYMSSDNSELSPDTYIKRGGRLPLRQKGFLLLAVGC